ncbi:MAG TPA: mechanosensitive ion channel family protein [Pseudonocardiaceae bacterium]
MLASPVPAQRSPYLAGASSDPTSSPTVPGVPGGTGGPFGDPLNAVQMLTEDPTGFAAWFAERGPDLLLELAKGAGRIVLILVVAFVLRRVVHRAIDRFTQGGGDSTKLPVLLRPLKERRPEMAGPLLSERRAQRAKTIGSLLRSVSSFVILMLAFLMVLSQLGIELGPIIASAGIVGIALGFGAQNLVKDFLSGIFMMLEDQYGVGDIVNLGEATGVVEAVGLRVTTVRDINGTVWYVRNGEIMRVGNSSQGYAVAVVDLPVSHSTNVASAIELAGKVAAEATQQAPLAEDVLESPEVLGVEKVTEESVTLRLTVKVRPGRQWAVQRALRARIKSAFDEAGIEPPFALRAFGSTAASQN